VSNSMTFEELLASPPSRMRPVFQIHIPKSAGWTVTAVLDQIGLTPLPFDMNTRSFFTKMNQGEWEEKAQGGGLRLGYFFRGHFRLDVPLLRDLQHPHVIVTALRDPIQRVLSHYNHTVRVPGNPWHEEVASGKMPFTDYVAWLVAPNSIGPQYSFFDDSGDGGFAYSGKASAQQCLKNLIERVAVLGLTERIDELVILIGFLLRRANVLGISPRNVTADLAGAPPKTELTEAEQASVTKLLADDIWFYKEATKEYERRLAHPAVAAVMAETIAHIRPARESTLHLGRVFGKHYNRQNAIK
jgi:hypothetical protein